MDRGGWQATVHGVPKSKTQLKRLSRHKIPLTKMSLDFQVVFENVPKAFLWLSLLIMNTNHLTTQFTGVQSQGQRYGNFSWYNLFNIEQLGCIKIARGLQFRNYLSTYKVNFKMRSSLLPLLNKIKTFMFKKSPSHKWILIDKYDDVKSMKHSVRND